MADPQTDSTKTNTPSPDGPLSMDSIVASMIEPASKPPRPVRGKQAVPTRKEGSQSPAPSASAAKSTRQDEQREDNRDADLDAEESLLDLADPLDEEAEGDDDASGAQSDELHPEDATVSDDEDEIEGEGGDALDDATDEGAADEGEEPEPYHLRDDDELFVTVDGNEVKATLGDLKKRYAGAVAIERRLQEATESRKAARETHDTVRKVAEVALQTLSESLFKRTVPRPDEALRVSNPQQYLLQEGDYNRESAFLQQQHMKLAQAVQAVDQQNAELSKNEREVARRAIHEALPVLRDPVRGPGRKKAIIDAALAVGFTAADISAAQHPGLFKLADLAADGLKYRAAKGKGKVVPVVPKKRAMGGGSNAAGKVSTSTNRQQAALAAKAKETGKVDDVAMTMIVPAKRRRG